MNVSLLENEIEEVLWLMIYKEYSFHPNINENEVPFSFKKRYSVYKLTKVWTSDEEAFINSLLMKLNQEFYVLDWHHDAFRYIPSISFEAFYDFKDKDNNIRSFPSFYPDGDYHIFISKDLKNIMFSDPWRNSVYIVGRKLMKLFNKNQEILSLEKCNF